MKRFNNFFRIIFFLVAVLHCIGLIKNSLIEIEELETYKLEISDSDTNESESEEREEEELLNPYYNKESNLKKNPEDQNQSQISFFIYQFNIKSQVQSVLESPPELKLS